MPICTFCVMDTTDPDIHFDAQGQCNHCRSYLDYVPKLPAMQPDAKQRLDDKVKQIKHASSGQYDCVIGLSGGVDSTYLAYVVKRILGLNPIAVHMDNGWNSEASVQNVENIVTKLDIDLYTKILDWEAFRDLQLAFLKASTPDSEIPTDHAICATLYQVAKRYGVKTIISGANQVTERIMPPAWSQGHGDYRYIAAIYRQFTGKTLKHFPYLDSYKRFYYQKLFNIQFVPLFDYFRFDLTTARQTIIEALDWQDYGGKHYESVYTKYFQGHILPSKFGFDKRKGHYSNLICAGMLSREAALEKLQTPPIPTDEVPALSQYIAKKFNLSLTQLDQLFAQTPKHYRDYPNQYNTLWYTYSRKYIKPIYRFFYPVRGAHA